MSARKLKIVYCILAVPAVAVPVAAVPVVAVPVAAVPMVAVPHPCSCTGQSSSWSTGGGTADFPLRILPLSMKWTQMTNLIFNIP